MIRGKQPRATHRKNLIPKELFSLNPNPHISLSIARIRNGQPYIKAQIMIDPEMKNTGWKLPLHMSLGSTKAMLSTLSNIVTDTKLTKRQ